MGTFRLNMEIIARINMDNKNIKTFYKKKSKKSKKPTKLEALTMPSFYLDSTAVYQEIKGRDKVRLKEARVE